MSDIKKMLEDNAPTPRTALPVNRVLRRARQLRRRQVAVRFAGSGAIVALAVAVVTAGIRLAPAPRTPVASLSEVNCTWSEVPVPHLGPPNGGSQLDAVDALSRDDAWAVGVSYQQDDRASRSAR